MEQLKAKLRDAVQNFLGHDSDLLALAAHEQAISHRIAVYLEQTLTEAEFSAASVDCEYNKHLAGSKTMRVDLDYFRQFAPCGCRACEILRQKPASLQAIPEKQFRPDVIVHHRGDDTLNLLAIELKRNAVCPFDLAKLHGLTMPLNAEGYGYRLGAFISFPQGRPEYIWVS